MSSQLTSPTPPSARGRSVEEGKGSKFLERLFSPVDVASLVFFRVAFGAIMLWEAYSYYAHDWIGLNYVEPRFHFTFYGFGWVQPWPGNGLYLHFIGLGVLAAFIALGFMYRLSATLFFLGFTYVFLLEQESYLNHFYFVCLISLLLIFVPAHRAFSVDAWLRPGIRSDTAPAWSLWLLMAQIGIVYFFGGLAKLNGDWLRGEPMGIWLTYETSFPVIGRWFTEWWAAYMFSYGGLLLDLFAVPFLLWRRTRPYAFLALLVFHLMNAQIFTIGIFPWFMIAATLLFFPPSWPRLVARLRLKDFFSPLTWPRLARRLPRIERRVLRRTQRERHGGATAYRWRYAIVGLLGLYLAVQVLLPLRPHLYPGKASWTEEGHRFSWNMMLRQKQSLAHLFTIDPASGEAQWVRKMDYVTRRQADAMAGNPEMILQLAQRVKDDLREQGRADVEVRALAVSSLNGREPQRIIDPTVDLGAEPRTLAPADWIEPLKQPFPEERRWGIAGDDVRTMLQAEIEKTAEEAGLSDALPPPR